MIDLAHSSVAYIVVDTQVLETQSFTVAAIRRIGSQILLDSRFLHDMYSADITEAEVKEEVEKYVPSLLKWTAQYLALGERHAMGANAQKRLELRHLVIIYVNSTSEKLHHLSILLMALK